MTWDLHCIVIFLQRSHISKQGFVWKLFGGNRVQGKSLGLPERCSLFVSECIDVDELALRYRTIFSWGTVVHTAKLAGEI